MPYDPTNDSYFISKLNFQDIESQYSNPTIHKHSPAADQYLCELLQEARLKLALAQTQIVSQGWNASHTALYEAVGDAIYASTSAINRTQDQPDF